MVNEKQLLDAGIDYKEGVKRFSGHESLYEKYLFNFEKDEVFLALEEAMEKQDYETAFKKAHALKGLVGNLSFKELFRMIVPFVEALRDGFDIPHAVAMFPELDAEYHKLLEAIRNQKTQ